MAKNNPYQPKINTGLSLKKGQSFGTNKMNVKGNFPSFSTPKATAPSYTAPKVKVTLPKTAASKLFKNYSK